MQAGRDGLVLFGRAPGAHLRIDEHGWLVLTSEPGADFNMAAVLQSAPTAVLDGYVDEIERRGLGAVVLVDEDAPHLEEVARARGLTSVGAVPVMVWARPRARTAGLASRGATRRGERRTGSDRCDGRRVLDGRGRAREGHATVGRVGGHRPLGRRGRRRRGRVLLLRFPSGTHVGVYSMATRRAFQRQGIGRAILETAMRHYLDGGVTTFTLEATEAGFPLYERVGFRTAVELTAFTVGASAQFPGADA